MIKNVILSNENYGLTVAGVESCTAQLFKYFDKKYKLYLIPRKNVFKYDLQKYTLDNFGIDLKNKILPAGYFTKGFYINVAMDVEAPKFKPAIHIVHFPQKKQINKTRFRKNLYKLFKEFLENIKISSLDKKYRNGYSYYICNSEFTAAHFKEFYPDIADNKIKIFYHPVKLLKNNLKPRKPQIVIFSRIDKDKKIDLLINTFCAMFSKTNLKLIVMGSAYAEWELPFLDCIKKIIDPDVNIEFVINPNRSKVAEVLSESRIYWHAKGFAEYDPYNFEHYGITTVEAMSAGLIPIVINKGGQKEIVDHGVNGFRWDTVNELIKYTNDVLSFQDERFREMSLAASQKAAFFGEDKFTENFAKIMQEMGL